MLTIAINRLLPFLLLSILSVGLLAPSALLAQPAYCADFSGLQPSAQPVLPNTVIFEDGISTITSLGISAVETYTGQSVIRSTSLLIAPADPSEAFSQVFLNVYLFKNGQKISVNGAPGHEITLADTLPVQIAPGVTLQLLSVPVGTTIGELSVLLSGTIEQMTIFPDEFLLMGLCADNVPVQNGQCLVFEGLAPPLFYGAPYGTAPGTVFHTESDIHFSIEPYFSASGDSTFGIVAVTSGPPLNQPVSFLAQQASLGIDCSDYPQQVSRLTVLLQQDGGTLAVGLNGVTQHFKIDDLVSQPGPFILGSNALGTVEPGPAAIASSVRLTIWGPIESLQLGGEALSIGSICLFSGLQPLDVCLPLDDLPAGIYELGSGYSAGETLEEFAGVTLSLTAPADPSLPTFIEAALAVPGAPGGSFSGTFLHLFNGGQLGVGTFPLPVQEVTFDYKTSVNDTMQIDGWPIIIPQQLNNTSQALGSFMLSGTFNQVTGFGTVTISGPEITTLSFDHAGILIDNICLGSLSGTSLPSACLDWEEADAGTLFGIAAGNLPGDTIYTEDQVTVTVQGFLTESGDTLFGSGIIDHSGGAVGGSMAHSAFYSDLNLVFDFSQYGQVGPLSFAYTQSLPGCNLSVNGQPPVYYESLEDAQGTIAPGVTFNYNPALGLALIEGPITALTIGGAESLLDNVCFEAAECQITSLVADGLKCSGVSGQYQVDLYLAWQHHPSQLFRVYADSILLGVFEGGQFPLEDLPFSAQSDSCVITVCADGQVACCAEVTIDLTPCQTCAIEELAVDSISCINDSTYQLTISCDPMNAPGVGFDLLIDGQFYAFFEYASLPVTIDVIVTANTVLELSVCDHTQAGCCSDPLSISLPDCQSPTCTLSEFEAVAFCDGSATFIEFSFVSDYSSDSFSVISCSPLGTFAYGSGSYVIEIDADSLMCSNPDAVPFGIYDQEEPGTCNALTLIALPDCDQQCSITELEAIPTDCEDGEFSFDISFEAEHTGSDFLVFVNGVFSGLFSYADLPVQVGPFEGDGQTVYTIEVTDIQDPACSASVVADPVACDLCQLDGLEAEAFCIDGTYYVEFTFDATGTSDSFIVQTCLPLAVLPYGQNSYLIEIPESQILCAGGQVFPFGIYDANNPGTCWDATLLSVPDCPPICQFENLEVQATPCDDGQFYAELSFVQGVSDSLGFLVFANNLLFGPYDYGQNSYLVGPLIGDNTTDWDFLLVDLADPFCFGFAELGTVDCDTCPTVALDATAVCQGSSGLVSLMLVVSHPGADTSWQVQLDGDSIGTITLAADSGTDTFAIQPLLLVEDQHIIGLDIPGSFACAAVDTVPSPACPLVACLDLNPWQDSVYQTPDYQPGDTILTASGVTVSFSFDNQDVSASVQQDPGFGLAQGAVLQTTSNLDFSFAALPGLVTNLQFAFQGDTLLIGISGQDTMQLVPATIQGDTVLSLGIDFTLFVSNSATFSGETIFHLSGVTDAVLLGTPDGSIANLCFEYDDDVWPGDADFDNTALNTDILAIGLAFGATGPARDSVSISWQGLPADDWPAVFADGTNIKHADCNGDGIIDASDVTAVGLNYGLTHGQPTVLPPHPGAPSDPPLFFDWPDWSTLTPGQQVVIPLNLGQGTNQVDALYGVAFELDVDTTRFSNFYLEFQPNWLADIPTEGLAFVQSFAGGKKIAAALTRTDQQDANGAGTLGYFIGIIDDLAGLTVPPIEIKIQTATDVAETLVPLYSPNTLLQVSGPPWWKKHVIVGPNPSIGVFKIYNRTGLGATELVILNARGIPIHRDRHPGVISQIDGSSWMPGLYFLHIRFEDGSIHAEPILRL